MFSATLIKTCDESAEIFAASIAAVNIEKQANRTPTMAQVNRAAVAALALYSLCDASVLTYQILNEDDPEMKKMPERITKYFMVTAAAIHQLIREFEDINEPMHADGLLHWYGKMVDRTGGLYDLGVARSALHEFVDAWLGENNNVHDLRN